MKLPTMKSPRGKAMRKTSDPVIQEGSNVHNEEQSDKPKEKEEAQADIEEEPKEMEEVT